MVQADNKKAECERVHEEVAQARKQAVADVLREQEHAAIISADLDAASHTLIGLEEHTKDLEAQNNELRCITLGV